MVVYCKNEKIIKVTSKNLPVSGVPILHFQLRKVFLICHKGHKEFSRSAQWI